MARRAPLGHVAVRRPMLCHRSSHPPQTLIRRTPATEALGRTLGIPNNFAEHVVDMRGIVSLPAVAWVGAMSQQRERCKVLGADALRFFPNCEPLAFVGSFFADMIFVSKLLVDQTQRQ